MVIVFCGDHLDLERELVQISYTFKDMTLSTHICGNRKGHCDHSIVWENSGHRKTRDFNVGDHANLYS
jgi:hypothetical protein